MNTYRAYHPSPYLLAATIICLAAALIFSSCARTARSPEEAGFIFLEALQQGDFDEAIDMSTDSTAAILILMSQMMAVNETNNQEMDFPIPASGADIQLVNSNPGDEYSVLRFSDGNRSFVLHAIEFQDTWLITLPRESW